MTWPPQQVKCPEEEMSNKQPRNTEPKERNKVSAHSMINGYWTSAPKNSFICEKHKGCVADKQNGSRNTKYQGFYLFETRDNIHNSWHLMPATKSEWNEFTSLLATLGDFVISLTWYCDFNVFNIFRVTELYFTISLVVSINPDTYQLIQTPMIRKYS